MAIVILHRPSVTEYISFVHNSLKTRIESRMTYQDRVNEARSILLKLEFSSNDEVQVNSRSLARKQVPS